MLCVARGYQGFVQPNLFGTFIRSHHHTSIEQNMVLTFQLLEGVY